MKKIWLIALIILNVRSFVFTQEFFSWKNEYFEPYIAGACNLENSRMEPEVKSDFSALNWGAKVLSQSFEGRFYAKEEKKTLGFSFNDSALINYFSKKGEEKLVKTSVSDFLDIVKLFPIEIKIGNLSAGGLLSKMNSPGLSTSTNPFSTGLASSSAVRTFLPGSASFSNPFSYFGEIAFSKKDGFLKESSINMLIRSDEMATSYIFSYYGKFFLPDIFYKSKKSFLSLGAGGGIFPFFYDNFFSASSWFNKIKAFEDKNCFSGQINLFYSSSFYKANLFFNLYQNPYGGFAFSLRNENKISFGRLSLSFSEFLNPYQVIFLPSQKLLDRQFQLKASVLYSSFIRSNFVFFKEPLIRVKYGISLYLSQKNDLFSYKAAAGLQLMDATFFSSLWGNCSFKEKNFDSASINIKIRPSLIKINPTFGEILTISKSSRALSTSEKTSINYTIGNKKSFYASGTFAFCFSQNNWDLSKITLNSSLTFRLLSKNLKTSAKFSISYAFALN
ncbi:MAG: hypothetical protein K5829_05735 [Treponema sp.]|nr:hypothetical protein [Treponema sp.]